MRPVTTLWDYKFSLRDAGGLITNVAKAVASVWNVEDKYIAYSSSSATDYNGAVGQLTAVAQGDDYNVRNGRSIKCISAYFAFTIRAHASSVTGNIARILVVRDHAMSGTSPTPSDILGSSVGSTLGVLSPIVVNNEQRFEVLTDQRVDVSKYGQDGDVRTGAVAMPLKAHTLYLGTGATAADCGLGTIHFLVISDVAANPPTTEFYSRIRFVDN